MCVWVEYENGSAYAFIACWLLGQQVIVKLPAARGECMDYVYNDSCIFLL